MTDITIEPFNEVHVKIKCDRGIAKELSDAFSFFVPGYFFMTKYKNKMWDGKIRLFNLNTQLIYKGLVTYIKEYAEMQDYSFKNNIPAIKQITDSQISDYLKEAVINQKYKPRYYQIDGLKHAVNNNRGLFISPTGSGKSFIIHLIEKFYGKKTIVIVPTKGLVNQMYGDFVEYDPSYKNKVTLITGEESKNWKKGLTTDIVVTTWQSIYWSNHSLGSLYIDCHDMAIYI